MADATNIYAGVAGYFGKPDHPGKFGVFQRAAKGGDWKHVLGSAEAYTVFVHPANPEIVFAGTNDGVWRSTDRGATFKQASFPDAKKQVWCFMVDSRDPKKMLAGGSPIDVYRSDDTGLSWRKLPTPKMPEHCKGPFASRVMRFAQHPTRPNEIFAALEINGVMHSTDGGESWTDCSAGLLKLAELPHLKSKIVSDTTAEGMLDSHAITINPARPDTAIAALRMGLFSTTDQGKTWQDMDVRRFSPTTYGRDVKVSASEPDTLYAALSVAASSHDGGLYRSRDGGQSWQRFDKVQVHGTIMSIGLHQRDPAQVYIGARYDGEIFGTQDGGKSWQAMPLPGEVQHIYSVACG
jgi:photosystem II stability/assembly factor-like uncharacterized protein